MNDFYIVGNQERLGVVGCWGNSTIWLNSPQLTSVDFRIDPPEMSDFGPFDRVRHCVRSRGVTMEFSVRAAGGEYVEGVPKDLRVADDMTVRELLAAINRKVTGRAVA